MELSKIEKVFSHYKCEHNLAKIDKGEKGEMAYIAGLYSRSKYLSNNLTLVTFLPPALPLESFLEPDSFSDREWWRTLVTLE